MGIGMAANLLKAGQVVTVCNRTPVKTETLIAQGAKAARSIAETCRGDAIVMAQSTFHFLAQWQG
jgi:3-hydroxyisobutyrate dehydrogenase-like beta-hydroxyacid dehydrogenase